MKKKVEEEEFLDIINVLEQEDLDTEEAASFGAVGIEAEILPREELENNVNKKGECGRAIGLGSEINYLIEVHVEIQEFGELSSDDPDDYGSDENR